VLALLDTGSAGTSDTSLFTIIETLAINQISMAPRLGGGVPGRGVEAGDVGSSEYRRSNRQVRNRRTDGEPGEEVNRVLRSVELCV
jgi:hypothetical protein